MSNVIATSALCAASVLLLAISIWTAISPAQSQEKAISEPRIISDKESNTVRIFIDDREVVTIDQSGIRINGDLSYTGTLADTSGDGHAP